MQPQNWRKNLKNVKLSALLLENGLSEECVPASIDEQAQQAITDALSELARLNLLKTDNKKYIVAVCASSEPQALAAIWINIVRHQIPLDHIFLAAAKHPEINSLDGAFCNLADANLLNADNENYLVEICTYTYPLVISTLFICLKKSTRTLPKSLYDICPQTLVNRLRPFIYRGYMESMLPYLYDAGLWQEQILGLIMSSVDANYKLPELLEFLAKINLLNEDTAHQAIKVDMGWTRDTLANLKNAHELGSLNLLTLPLLFDAKTKEQTETLSLLKMNLTSLDPEILKKLIQHGSLHLINTIISATYRIRSYDAKLPQTCLGILANLKEHDLLQILQLLPKFDKRAEDTSLEFIFENSGFILDQTAKKRDRDSYYQSLYKTEFDLLLGVLNYLAENKILTRQRVEIALEHYAPINLALAWIQLNKKNLLQTYQEYVISFPLPYEVASAICYLDEANLLTPENVIVVCTHPAPVMLAMGYAELNQKELLGDYREIIAKHLTHPGDLATSIVAIHAFDQQYGSELLTVAAVDFLVQTEDPHHAGPIYMLLQAANLWSVANFNLIEKDYYALGPLALQFAAWNLLDAHNFNQISINTTFFRDPQISHCILRIPEHAFFTEFPDIPTAENFLTQLVLIAQQTTHDLETARNLVEEYIGGLLVLLEGLDNQPAVVINDNQSTHTKSVHISSTQTALNLLEDYGEELNAKTLQKVLQEFLQWSNGLHIAAKTAANRLIQPNYYTDQNSNISTRELLGLSWLAIHDTSRSLALLDDAKKQLANGLWEIQREYNINSRGQDTGGRDKSTCPAGSFNKIIEKLKGVYARAILKFITLGTVSYKLPYKTWEIASNFLKYLARPKTMQELSLFIAFLDKLQEQGTVKLLWKSIKHQVAKEMYEEYGSLYKSPTDPKFIQTIKHASSSPIGKLPSLQKELAASGGYHEWCGHLIKGLISCNAFFPLPRIQLHGYEVNLSEEDQHEFNSIVNKKV